MADESSKRILTIDGGGMRGLIPATVLLKLQDDWMDGKPIHESFDMIGGTSTGALLAAGIGILKFSPQECIENYKTLASKIFPSQGNVKKILKVATAGEQYRAAALEEALKSLTGDILMNANQGHEHGHSPMVFTVAARANLTPSPAYLFRSWRWNRMAGLPPGPSPNMVPIWEATKASASAPTYFKPHIRADGTALIDGGMGFNNPTLLAIHEIEAQAKRQLDQRDVVLSLGTGLEIFEVGNAESIFWLGNNLIKIVTDTKKTHENVHALMNKQGFRYFRINPQYKVPNEEDAMATSNPKILQYYVENTDQLLSTDPDILAKMASLADALNFQGTYYFSVEF